MNDRYLLEVDNLYVNIYAADNTAEILKGVSLQLKTGEAIAIVGKSGSGKTMLCRAIMGMLPKGGCAESGAVKWAGRDITALKESEMQKIRGRDIAMVFQDSVTAFNPVMTVGRQIGEAVAAHSPGMSRTDVKSKVLRLMKLVEIERETEMYDAYPGQLSGGMRQRCAIAMAIAQEPKLLLADEPTTALDAETKGKITELLVKIKEEFHMSMIVISHDLGVASALSERIVVMEDGRICKAGIAQEHLVNPDCYCSGKGTGILQTTAKTGDSSQIEPCDIVRIEKLSKTFSLSKSSEIKAIEDVTLSIKKGEIFGLIGESGSGKTTIAQCLMNICSPTAGRIFYDGIEITDSSEFRKNRKRLHSKRQLIFQDSNYSLNPKMKVADIIAEPMRIQGFKPLRGSLREEAAFQLRRVDMGEDFLDRCPKELSGGQRQRVAIARALCMEPELLVADEPVSSLDLAVQEQIVELFRRLRREKEFSMLFIAHDLNLTGRLCSRIGVMHRGKLIEVGTPEQVFGNPQQPYTKELVSAALAQNR